MARRTRQQFDSRILDAIGPGWTDPSVVERTTGQPYVYIQAQVALLVEAGLVREEIRGGRVRRLENKRSGRRPGTGYPNSGPDCPRQLDVTPDVDRFLQDQYEPVSTSVVAWSVFCPIEQAREALCTLRERGKASELEPELWVGA